MYILLKALAISAALLSVSASACLNLLATSTTVKAYLYVLRASRSCGKKVDQPDGQRLDVLHQIWDEEYSEEGVRIFAK